MKTTVRNIGVAERNAITAVLDEVPPSKTNRAFVRNIRRCFNVKGLRGEINALRSVAIQKAMDEALADNLMKVLESAIEKAEVEKPLSDETREIIGSAVERVVRTVAGPQMLRTVSLSWEDLAEAEPATTSFEVDKTDLKMFRKFYDDKKDWAWKDSDRKEPAPPPNALHEVLANLDEAIDEALKE